MNVRSGVRGLLLGLALLPGLGVSGTIVGKVVLAARRSGEEGRGDDRPVHVRQGKGCRRPGRCRRSRRSTTPSSGSRIAAGRRAMAGRRREDRDGSERLRVRAARGRRARRRHGRFPQLAIGCCTTSTPRRSSMSGFNRTQPKSRTVPVDFAKPEIVRIDCDLHSWMIGWVVVAAHPFYAITGRDGQFVVRQSARRLTTAARSGTNGSGRAERTVDGAATRQRARHRRDESRAEAPRPRRAPAALTAARRSFSTSPTRPNASARRPRAANRLRRARS